MGNSRVLSLILLVATQLSCGGIGSSKKVTPTDLSIMIPLMALTSPVASTSGSGPSYASILADVTNRAVTEKTATNCFKNIDVTPFYPTITCFGPAISYDNHPNGAATNVGTSTDCVASPRGCLLKGDVGAWSNNESTTSNEACMVAQANSLTKELSYIFNNALKLAAGTVCGAQAGGTAMPAIGVTTNAAVAVQDAMQLGSATTATVGRLADLGDGKNTYTVSYNIVIGPVRYVVTLIHSTAADKSAFKGKMYGYVDINYSYFSSAVQFPTSSDRKGFSAIYDYQSNVLKVQMESVTVPTTTAVSNFLDSNGDITYTTYLAGTYPNSRDSRKLLTQINTTTLAGTAYYGWQQRPTDTYARLLKLDATTTTGFSYFGFSAKPGVAGYGSTLGGMFCNFGGPGASLGGYQTTNVQAQTFTLASGIFGSTTNNITYAPTNTCNTAGGTFKYGTYTGYAGASVGPTVNNNFVTQTANGTITSITAPVYP